MTFSRIIILPALAGSGLINLNIASEALTMDRFSLSMNTSDLLASDAFNFRPWAFMGMLLGGRSLLSISRYLLNAYQVPPILSQKIKMEGDIPHSVIL